MQLMYKIIIDFVPGRPGTEEFVPGQLLLPLSRDKGTAGQVKCPCPGTKGHRDVPSLGNASFNPATCLLPAKVKLCNLSDFVSHHGQFQSNHKLTTNPLDKNLT